jgi:5'-3' exonuclease
VKTQESNKDLNEEKAEEVLTAAELEQKELDELDKLMRGEDLNEEQKNELAAKKMKKVI